ncbi:MAG: hypothetical protein IBX69_14020 [Anaerolineales bacterium]|nr:hypothetical protein [Anaerolineales bacterium]
MAAALFKRILREKGLFEGWKVASAGTWSLHEQPAAEKTQHVLRNRGIDISHHRSMSIDYQLISSFDLVLTMEEGQKEALRAEFPDFASKIILLSEVCGDVVEISDPMGQPLVDFEDTANQIESYLIRGFEKILELTNVRSGN